MDATVRPAVATTCPYCGVGCGVLARVGAGDTVAIAGDPNHPANFGRLCSKGAALGETLGLAGRLTHPVVHGARASWDDALALVADAFGRAITKHGPDSVALYVSGQLLTEDYYVANKFMKGFVGSANIDTNSRLCMASSVAGHKRAFGADTVPGTYEDLEQADLVVLVGSNLAWCHPVLFQRLMAAKAERPSLRIVTIDPRRTVTSDAGDLHLPLRAETDVALFAGLLRYLDQHGVTDEAYIAAHTEGAPDALRAASRWTIEAVAAVTGLSRQAIGRFFSGVAATPRTVTVYSQGVNQSAVGTDKVNAILNTHLLTGRIGKPGSGPFSVTGQPNAMGGREVGGLANMLACHMDLNDAAHRAICQAVWNAPRMADKPGLKAVDLFEAVHEGRIKALWVMATNPSASLPNAARVDEALARVPFLAVSDVVAASDTVRHAHVALPATAWGEKDGTVTNSERRISRQRAFLPAPGETRPDWAIVSDVARRMGFSGFDYTSPAEIFDEFAQLSAADNHGSRDFDIGRLVGLGADGYARLAPVQWPRPVGRPSNTRFFARGGFYTPNRRARVIATPFAEPEKGSPRYPFVLNTGRVRDQWHTMTRTGRAPTLAGHLSEPYVEIHPTDAADHGIEPAALATLETPRGRIVVRALITDRQAEGSLFVPIHWTDQTASCARVDDLVDPLTDPISGQPALKSSRAAIAPYGAMLYGFALSTRPMSQPNDGYWARATLRAGTAMEFASRRTVSDLSEFAAELLDRDDLASVIDTASGVGRFAAFDQGRLAAAAFLAREPVAVSRAFVTPLLGQPVDAQAVLAGRPDAGRPDPGAIVCACFQVGANTIGAAAKNGADTLDAIGEKLGAGTNCGSCRVEIARLLSTRLAQAQPQDSARETVTPAL